MAMRVSGGRAALLVSRAQLARFSYFSSASTSSELEQPHSSALVDLKPGEIGKVSGIPEEHLQRKVVIYSPARTASQQGRAKLGKWKINFESTQKWENPLMGWTSTGDPYASVGESALSFNSKESAIEFAHKHGWKYTVRDPHEAIIQPKAYADKFKWKGPPEENES